MERQLELLDDLEREESDPDQLENLFKLDHLAARMRRNDESLLVLAGTDSTRRWNRPVGLGAVLLAAAAEIEQYQRVRLESVADVHVVGHAVGELVHLLAELLENATAFSRPDTVVVVTARVEARGSALIEIADHGLGMSPAALVEANAVLATPPAADVAAVERMGLFVVSHLAARLGVRVRSDGGEDGLVARLVLPDGPAGSGRRGGAGRAGVGADAGGQRRAGRGTRRAGPVRLGWRGRPRPAGRTGGTCRWPACRRRPPCRARPARCRCAPRTCWPRPAAVRTVRTADGAGGPGRARPRRRCPDLSAPPTTPVTGRHERAGPAGAGADGAVAAVTRPAQPVVGADARRPGPGGGRRHALPALQRGTACRGRGHHRDTRASVRGARRRGTTTVTTLSQEARDLSWLVSAFAERVPGVAHAVVVSSDGLLVAISDHLPRDNADKLAAVTSGLMSITAGAAQMFDGDIVKQTVVEMGRGYFLVMQIRDGSILATLAAGDADIGVVGYEMARLAKQAGEMLTPALRAELQQALPR